MKRDFELIRKILIEMEERNEESSLEIDGYTDDQIGYHAYIMEQAGLILAYSDEDFDTIVHQRTPICLTWAGHDFLDAIKDDTIWEKAKEKVLKPAGRAAAGAMFAVLLHWLKDQAIKVQ